mmetsp:Transcript_27065/g.43749  ORF Transcript_27065/g.43749 Transcript_27065/m.43749 type:complete len:233 (-) Transcript_27065:2580-3278(-)
MKRIGDKFEFRDEGELTRLAQKYDITPLKQRPNLSLKLTSMPPGKPVVWKSNKQKVVAMSSGEAEYIALSDICRELVYVTQLLQEFKMKIPKPVPVYCDSQAAISIAAKPGFTQKGKNIRIEYHNVRDNYQTKQICINKIPGEDNPADILTKALPGPSNKKHCDFLFPISYREKLTIMLQGTRKRKITTKTLPHKLPRLVVAPRPFRNLSLRQVSYYGLYAQLCAQLRWGRM